MLDQEVAAFIFEKAFFEADLAAFDVGEDLFELGEGFLEGAGRGLSLSGHVGEDYRKLQRWPRVGRGSC